MLGASCVAFLCIVCLVALSTSLAVGRDGADAIGALALLKDLASACLPGEAAEPVNTMPAKNRNE